MKKFLPILTAFLLAIASLRFVPPAKADLIFSDSFQNEPNGYNSTWYVYPGATTPVRSTNGITGSTNTNVWSIIALALNQNYNLNIQFDLTINDQYSNDVWSLGIGDDVNKWKIINTYQSSLQLRESQTSGERNIPFNWDRSAITHHFEILVSPLGNTQFVVKEDGQERISWLTTTSFDMSILWISFLGHGDYEMSNFVLSSQESPTPTPTPTPTPSPTPTATPTQTPTPTPTGPKKVFVLHGGGGSWNADALINCKPDNYIGGWSPWNIANLNMYQPLLSALQTEGYQPIPFYYDWRKTVTAIVPVLRSFIHAQSPPGQTVDMVGHSQGGLVGRAYLESEQTTSRLEKIMTVGSPHRGMPFAYPLWSAGALWTDYLPFRLGFAVMKYACLSKRGLSARETVTQMIPSIRNLLPIIDYLKRKDGSDIPVSSMQAQNNWLLPTAFGPPYFGVTMGTLNGTERNTLRTIEVKPPNRMDQLLGNWRDGKPTGKRLSADGDGFVLSESSELPDVQSFTLPLDHGGIISDPSAVDTIIGFLNGAATGTHQRTQNQSSAASSALLVVMDGGSATLLDKHGNIFRDNEGQITLLSPSDEEFTLTIKPKRLRHNIFVIQLFDDGTDMGKVYQRYGILAKSFKLRFDRQHRNNDVLREK